MELVVSRRIAAELGLAQVTRELRRVEHPIVIPYAGAARQLIELEGHLAKAAEIEAIVGPSGPQLSAASLHALVWEPAARLWSDGHHLHAVQAAAQAVELKLQAVLGKHDVGGKELANAFLIKPPTVEWPRLRIPGMEEGGRTWNTAHEGAGHLVRGAFQYVRNLASHGGAPDPTDAECLEQLAVLSMVARLVERCGEPVRVES